MTDTNLMEIFCVIDGFCKYFVLELENIRWTAPADIAVTVHASCSTARCWPCSNLAYQMPRHISRYCGFKSSVWLCMPPYVEGVSPRLSHVTFKILHMNIKTPDFTFSGMKKECKSRKCLIYTLSCGERGIRTPDTLLTYTRFPGVPLQPLEHLS